jgi:hypothetical protein
MNKREIISALAVLLISCGTARSDELPKEDTATTVEPCAKPLDAVHCLSLLPAPEGLPKTVEMASVRAYAERLLTLQDSIVAASDRVVALKKLSWPSAGQRYLERAVQATQGLKLDSRKSLENFQNFHDLQYHASRSSLGASRTANFLAELRLAIPAGDNYEEILQEIQDQMKSYDELSVALLPDWLK